MIAPLENPEFAWLAGDMPGGIHCRPDGGDAGKWLKLGWAYNQTPATATWHRQLDDNFPDIVLRGAARLNPALKTYYGQLPRNMHHYGGLRCGRVVRRRHRRNRPARLCFGFFDGAIWGRCVDVRASQSEQGNPVAKTPV